MKTPALLALSGVLAVTAAVTMARTACADDGDLPKAALTKPTITGPQYLIIASVVTSPHDNTPIMRGAYKHAGPFGSLADCQKFMANDAQFKASLQPLALLFEQLLAQNPGAVPDVSCQPMGSTL